MIWFRLFRFPNLLIVALTQYLTHFVLIDSPRLAGWHFALLVLDTVLIAASGYLINDLSDIAADRVNKPHKMAIGNKISPQTGWKLYFFLLALGMGIAIYLGWFVKRPDQVLLFPLATAALAWYARRGKKDLPLLGNLLVSAFCAFVPGVVLYAERQQLEGLSQAMIWYLLLAFLSTLFREIVKDLEDEAGDRVAGRNTLPILIGRKKASNLAFVCGLLLLAALAPYASLGSSPLIAFLALAAVLPMGLALFFLLRANTPADFHRISTLAKGIILGGLLSLAFF